MFFLLTIFFIIVAYLFGSLSSAIIVCKAMGLADPRTQGSMNPGATNVLRTGTKKAAALVLLADALKGFIPIFAAKLLGISYFGLSLMALAAVIGHMYPIFFNFKGGKGVATGLGVMFGLSFFLGLIASLLWLLILAITRYVVLASIFSILIAAILSPWLLGTFSAFIPLLIIAILVIYRHHNNLGRLFRGEEGKMASEGKK